MAKRIIKAMTKHDATILAFPRQMKLDCLEVAARDDNFPVFFGLSKVLLDVPISEGGIETDLKPSKGLSEGWICRAQEYYQRDAT